MSGGIVTLPPVTITGSRQAAACEYKEDLTPSGNVFDEETRVCTMAPMVISASPEGTDQADMSFTVEETEASYEQYIQENCGDVDMCFLPGPDGEVINVF